MLKQTPRGRDRPRTGRREAVHDRGNGGRREAGLGAAHRTMRDDGELSSLCVPPFRLNALGRARLAMRADPKRQARRDEGHPARCIAELIAARRITSALPAEHLLVGKVAAESAVGQAPPALSCDARPALVWDAALRRRPC